MISYSQNSRNTAQKIADKVANGAYFYSYFTVEADNTVFCENIENLILKLTRKYHLDLSVRQRTYRLNQKKEPIADLIVQKRIRDRKCRKFDFYLLITTFETKNFNDEKERAIKPLTHQKVQELQSVSDKNFEKEQIGKIQTYFQDHEKFKFILNKPFLKLTISGLNVELVRLSHSSKSSKKYDNQQSKKGYTWTWRFDDISVAQVKQNFIKNINLLISNKDKSVGEESLKQFYRQLRYCAVFKGNRHQIGRIFVETMRYHKTKTNHNFKDMDYYVELKLNYLARIENYADDFMQFVYRVNLEEDKIYLNKSEINLETYNYLLNKYFV